MRGGAEQFIQEAERSLNDAIMIVRRAMKANKIVPGIKFQYCSVPNSHWKGGGAIEMEISRFLRQHARSVDGKIQLIINAFAKALETIPRTISDNAGLDSVDVLNKLRQKHALDPGKLISEVKRTIFKEGKNFGVDINSALGIINTYNSFIWEPIVVKQNALSAAAEVNIILTRDMSNRTY